MKRENLHNSHFKKAERKERKSFHFWPRYFTFRFTSSCTRNVYDLLVMIVEPASSLVLVRAQVISSRKKKFRSLKAQNRSKEVAGEVIGVWIFQLTKDKVQIEPNVNRKIFSSL